MSETLERVRTGAVAPAARDDVQGRFRAGDAVGFVEEELVAWGEPRETLRDVLEQLAADAELITCLRGRRGAARRRRRSRRWPPARSSSSSRDGGQPSYWWLLSAE